MRSRFLLVAMWLCACIGAGAQTTVVKAEYFVDTDPGFEAGTDVPISAGASIQDVTFAASLSALGAGMHNLFFRIKDSDGYWSTTQRTPFYNLTPIVAPPPVNTTAAEYYVDDDPGIGAATAITITPGVAITDVSFPIDLTSLTEGMHRLYVRFEDANGNWSTTQSTTFYKLTPIAAPSAADITELEYFIDLDPGIGAASALAVAPNVTISDVALQIDLSSLTEGSHRVFVRFKDANGVWGTTSSSLFYKLTPENPPAAADITQGEYFVDDDPGFGNAAALSISPGSSVDDLIIPLDVNLLSEGNHKLFVRFKDNNDVWSISQINTFSVCNQTPSVAIAATGITATSFTANWSAVASITDYKLDVSADDFVTFVPGFNQKAVTGTSSSVTGLTGGMIYKYRVNVVGTCLSVPSNVITAETTGLPPAVPSAIAGTSVGETSFTANWNAAAGATTYRLDVSADNFVNLLPDYSDRTVNGLSDAVSGLASGVTYSYRVRSVNSAGTSSNSNTITVTTIVLAPAAPNALAATNIAGESFTANWDAVYNADSYRLDVSADDFATTVSGFGDLLVATNSISVTGLMRSTLYKYRVRSVNITATSGNSSVISVTTTNKDDQTITFNALANKTYGDGPFNLVASSNALLPVSFSSSDTDVATISGSTVTIVGAGTTTITASQAGDADFNAAAPVDQVLVVDQAGQTITFNGLPAMEVTDLPFDLEATSSSGLDVSYVSSDPQVATIAGKTVTITGVGTTTITASQAGDNNFAEAPTVAQPLVVNKAGQLITFAALPVKAIGDAAFDLTATSDSQLPVSFSSSNVNVATVAGNTVTIVGPGTTDITASQAGDATYVAANDVTQTLTVTKQIQTITFDALPSKMFGDALFDLTATSDSQLPITFASSDVTVATISGNTVTIVGAGSTVITASQAGDNHYEAASAAQILSVEMADQSITFAALVNKTLGDAAFTPPATSSSGLEVTFSSSSDKLTIAANVVTMVKAGRATITANQSGDLNYNAATPVDRSFCINPPKPTITATGIDTESPTLTSSSGTGNQWFKDGSALSGQTNDVLHATSEGIYTVQVTVDDCASEISAGRPLIVTGLMSEHSTGITVYPNPVEDYLEVRGITTDLMHTAVFDMTGRTSSLSLERRGEVYRGSVQHLSPGVYLLRMQEGDNLHQVKFIKR
jgi:hypothetical protein